MKKTLIILLLLTWVISLTQLFSYSWEKIWDIKCSEINKTTRYSSLSPSIINKIDSIWDRINNKYIDKDNTYKEKIYNLYIKVLNQHLIKIKYSEVQKEVLLRIWDYFVCKKEKITNKKVLNSFNKWAKKQLDTSSNIFSKSKIIPNSLDLIWEDMNEKPIGYTVMTHWGMLQFKASDFKDISSRNIPRFNAWNEVEEEGDINKSFEFCPTPKNPNLKCAWGCLKGINKAVNTRVEIWTYRGWWMDQNNVWHSMWTASGLHWVVNPRDSSVFGSRRLCFQDYFTDILDSNRNEQTKIPGPLVRKENNGNISLKPKYYFRWHGFWMQVIPPTPHSVKVVFVQQYARLILDNPKGVDDRNLARYVMHIASDHKNIKWQTVEGALGISRFKRITKDWQPFNMITGISREELRKNPPPFISIP